MSISVSPPAGGWAADRFNHTEIENGAASLLAEWRDALLRDSAATEIVIDFVPGTSAYIAADAQWQEAWAIVQMIAAKVFAAPMHCVGDAAAKLTVARQYLNLLNDNEEALRTIDQVTQFLSQ